MGTETHFFLVLDFATLRTYVKLNNPLMGTETFGNRPSDRQPIILLVKLNNPLMGTETSEQFVIVSYCDNATR